MSKLDTSIENMTREQLIAEISMLKENCLNFREAFDSMSDILIRVDNELEGKLPKFQEQDWVQLLPKNMSN